MALPSRQEINMNDVLEGLVERAEAGDPSAQTELYRQLEPQMVRIVRRVVRHGAGVSSIDRRIQREAYRIGLDARAAQSADGDRLIRKVARCLSAVFVDGLQARPFEACAQNTVCA
jgi:hypothetical protein